RRHLAHGPVEAVGRDRGPRCPRAICLPVLGGSRARGRSEIRVRFLGLACRRLDVLGGRSSDAVRRTVAPRNRRELPVAPPAGEVLRGRAARRRSGCESAVRPLLVAPPPREVLPARGASSPSRRIPL